MVAILMMSAKLLTLAFLERKLFLNRDYGVIISVHDVIIKILSRDSNYIVDVVMRKTFGNFCISMRICISSNPQFYKDLTRKTTFLRGGLAPSCVCYYFFYL